MGRANTIGVNLRLIRVSSEDRGWHQSISPTTLVHQFLSVLTTTLARLADAQSEREATAAQSGEMKGEAQSLLYTGLASRFSVYSRGEPLRSPSGMRWASVNAYGGEGG